MTAPRPRKGQTHTADRQQACSALGTLSTACDHSHHSLLPCPDPRHPAEANLAPASPELPGTVSLCLLPEGPGLGSGAANIRKLRSGTAAPRSLPGHRTSELHTVRVWPGGPSLWHPVSLWRPSLSRPPSTWLPCTPVLTAQSTPRPGLSPGPLPRSPARQISFLSMEKRPNEALPC